MVMIPKCLDISYAQGSIDFNKVKSAGVTHLIIRIGYGKEVSQKDDWFETNYKSAVKLGFKVGGYWYSYAYNVADAKQEAAACLSCIANRHLDLPIYYDMEESRQTSYGRATLTNMAIAFCDAIKSGGYTPGVYSNSNWLTNYLDYNTLRGKYSIWLAQWMDPSRTPDYDCDIWQYTSSAHVPGITSNTVDGNKILKSDFQGSGSTANSPYVAYDAESVRAMIDHTALTSYIVTIDRKTRSLDYKKLKDIGVVGVMIEAGSLYSASHSVTTFRNPRLPDQVKSASDADIPFALYVDVRARNAEEAKREIAELHKYIMAYPPALGVWLHLHLSKSKKINNSIIDIYRTELTRFGLKGKIGIYATRDQMKLFDWDSYYNDYYLWLDDHVANMSEVDTLLTPEFFMLNNGG